MPLFYARILLPPSFRWRNKTPTTAAYLLRSLLISFFLSLSLACPKRPGLASYRTFASASGAARARTRKRQRAESPSAPHPRQSACSAPDGTKQQSPTIWPCAASTACLHGKACKVRKIMLLVIYFNEPHEKWH